jgi:hypothetical protein
LITYKKLVETLLKQGFYFQTFEEFLTKPKQKAIIMRHDVDLLPENSLKMAQLENELKIKASYYFRIVPQSLNPEIVKHITQLGHEIGYHYEDLVITKGNIDKAYDSFCSNLEKIRKFYPVKTICMHGSPLSRYDSRDIWKNYDYKSLGVIGEPYFDIDFSKVLYLTDTGRRWDGDKINVRDKIFSNYILPLRDKEIKTTIDIIKKVENNKLPKVIMINVHPQRWNNNVIPWLKELFFQNIKNQAKRIVNLTFST